MNMQLTKEQKAIYDKEVNPIVKRAQDFVIKTDEDNVECQKIIIDIKRQRKTIFEMFGKATRAAHESWKQAKNIENLFVTPHDDAEALLKRKSGQWIAQKEREVREANAKIEADRQEREAKKIESLNNKAVQAEADGNHAKADLYKDQAQNVYIAPKTVAPEQPKVVSGVSYRDKWTGEVTDIRALLQAILNKTASVNLISVNQSELNRLAGINKSELQVPGIRFRCEKVMSGRI